MSTLKKRLSQITPIKYFLTGRRLLNNSHYIKVQEKNRLERLKSPVRTDIINFLIERKQEAVYLEIGVRNPETNFNKIKAATKYSVDPGDEFKTNPVDFKMTSDVFFEQLSRNTILSSDIRFDVIFIDGLHLAEQVDRDIDNALVFLKDDGFIVLHDCNPPSEWHARESYYYYHSPAGSYWNGTTWKAFLKRRCDPSLYSCCIDSDFGVGVLSKHHNIGNRIAATNPFFEFSLLDADRERVLNLISFDTFKTRLKH